VEGRLEILQIHTRGMPLAGDVDLAELARHLHGYTGADLKALCREAALKALRRYLPEIDVEGELVDPKVLGEMVVTYQDFVEAMKEIVPTAMREFYVETPKVRWEDIGGLDRCKQLLRDNVTWAITDPERYRRVGVRPPKGVLLYGPPGCGKTLLAQALATESGANFIVVKGPEVLSKWVGESEKAIREIFRKAKASAPCIIFFDEIDALAKPRGEVVEDAGVGERVLSQLLTEMDASHSVDQVFVVAATNRPDLIDPSLLRPGRLDLLVYVPPPGPGERLAILRLLTKHMPLADDVDLEELASATDGYSGADLESLCRAAGLKALQRDGDNPHVAMQDFAEALREVGPSITKEMEEWYQGLGERLRGPRKGVAKTLYG
jgi:transitional endoplasmic reticulum ATPase